MFADPDYARTLADQIREAGAGIDPKQIVLEITERAETAFIDDLLARIVDLRAMGFEIAIDDVGAGDSGLNRIAALRPDWLKLDRELVRDIDADLYKQNLIRYFARFARLSNINVIAEGIEREAELWTLMDLGISHAQGFLLGRPAPGPATIDDTLRGQIVDAHHQIESRRLLAPNTVRVTALTEVASTIDLTDTVGDAVAAMNRPPARSGVVVLDGRRYIGWLSREQLEQAAPGPVLRLACIDCPVVGPDATLAEAMEIVAARAEEHLALPLVVQEGSVIRGIVSIRRMLQASAEFQLTMATHLASSTGLPGRVHADRWLADHIRAHDPADVSFIDLRDFDAYNVAYGFERGDIMLRQLVDLLQSHLVDDAGTTSLCAHLGGDRFIVAFTDDARPRLVELARRFDARRDAFFSPHDQASGTFAYLDPRGRTRAFPLTSLRITYLPRALQAVHDVRELYENARRLRQAPPVTDDPRAMGLIVDRRGAEIAARRSA
ncbi:MAG: EAL domain-containing protein [Phycisphaerales bacterium]|nr:EAL domain-containing protein [Phycisphaerales bacterium]